MSDARADRSHRRLDRSMDGVLDVCANVVCGIDEVHDLAHPSGAGQGAKWGMPGFAFFRMTHEQSDRVKTC